MIIICTKIFRDSKLPLPESGWLLDCLSPAHICCGSSLDEGMLVRFKTVDFPGKGVVSKKVVELWSDLNCHFWHRDREYLSFPPLSLSTHRLGRFCKVGWLGEGAACTI